jgi:class 3 adenylate cyclase
VLGDAVNLAARLEPACGAVGARPLFCEQTYDLVKKRPDILWRRLGELRVSGKDKTIKVFEALEPGEAGDGEWLAAFSEALVAYEGKRLKQARAGFARTDSLR